MSEHPQRDRLRVFRDHGTVDTRLWNSVQRDLFLEPKHSLSRVDVYPINLVVSSRDTIDSTNKCLKLGSNEPTTEAISCTVNNVDEDTNEDDFEPILFEALKTQEDINRYVGRTRKFRAFFVRQKFSWGPLHMTSDLFSGLMNAVKFPPKLKSFILYFGAREREVEISPPAFRFIRLPAEDEAAHFGNECIYGLRFMERNGRDDPERPSRGWSLRQSAICCRYAPKTAGASWLFVTVSKDMQQRLNSVVTSDTSLDDLDPFEIHFDLIGSAISSWRPYLVDLFAEIDSQFAQLLGTSPSDEGPIDLHESGRRQDLLILEEKLANVLLSTNATADTLYAMTTAWESVEGKSQTLSDYEKEFIRISFEDVKRDLNLIISQVESLRSKIGGLTDLLSSFLDLSSGFSLQNLVRESGKENEEMRRLSQRMHRLAEKSTQDAAAVKVLTILTLIYLPITVVSNFFSTSFVNTATSSNGSEHITVYGDWWILLAVSIPLTLVTIYVWLLWTRIQANIQKRPWWWYIWGSFMIKRKSKSHTQNQIGEKERHDTHETSTYERELIEEDVARFSQRTPSEIC